MDDPDTASSQKRKKLSHHGLEQGGGVQKYFHYHYSKFRLYSASVRSLLDVWKVSATPLTLQYHNYCSFDTMINHSNYFPDGPNKKFSSSARDCQLL